MEERTTAELMETLSSDVEECHRALVKSIDCGKKDADGSVEAEYEVHARQLVRAIFAYIEAVTFSVKIHAVEKCLKNGIDVSPEERFLAGEVSYSLNDKGDVVERPAQIRLAQNIRFAFSLQEKANRSRARFDPSCDWWSCLQSSIRVRDRLMHPRMPEDIDVSPDEVISALRAVEGFEAQVISCGARKSPNNALKGRRAKRARP